MVTTTSSVRQLSVMITGYDALARAQGHLCGILAKSAQPQSHH